MTAYYNEHDPYAAQWLRNLISAGHIAPGDVDERDIRDVTPHDLRKYDQCHFFAGIGVWSAALREAGWRDDEPVWTGSCPCQPFSAAGKGGGFDDERHLWPAFFHLIEQCAPDVVFGEQVASKDGLAWIDLVQADMEGTNYAFGALDLCAAGFGAPHIRQRLYWVADAADGDGRRGERGAEERTWPHEQRRLRHSSGGSVGLVVDADHEGPQGRIGMPERPDQFVARSSGVVGGLANTNGRDAGAERQQRSGEQRQQPEDGRLSKLEYACGERRERREATAPGHVDDRSTSRRPQSQHGLGVTGAHRILEDRAGPTSGIWRDADWLLCRDGKWRPVRPGSFPLAHGATARVGRLRAYGNAIVKAQAVAFIEAYLEQRDDRRGVRMTLNLKPITYKAACAYIAEFHRHHKPPQGHKFSIAAEQDGKICGVVVVGRPIARNADDGTTAEVTRLCTNGAENACSLLYGAAARAAKAMGYKRIITYILESEDGGSLRASGWQRDRRSAGGSWSRDERTREDKHPTAPKTRWLRLLAKQDVFA